MAAGLGRVVAAASAGLAALALATAAGCGDDDGAEPTPASRFAEALGEVSTGPIPVGVGFGYIDLASMAGDGAAWAGGALGPGGSILLTEAERITRATGFDPRAADRLLSVAASYTLGVRADGLDPRPAAETLRPAAQARPRARGWKLLDLGTEWSVPNGTPAQALSGLGARVALGDDAIVVSRTDRARTELTTPSDEVLTDPAVRVALACLGDPVAARIVPNNFTHAPNSGPQLLAFGVSEPRDGPPTETLCAADPSPELVDETVSAMERNLALDAVDPVTERRIGSRFERVEIDELPGDGAGAARARLEPAAGEEPGYLFDSFVHGSLITYLGLAAPQPD